MEAKSQAVKRLEEIKDGMGFRLPRGVGSWGWKKTFFFSDLKGLFGRVEKSEDFFLEKESRELTYLYDSFVDLHFYFATLNMLPFLGH